MLLTETRSRLFMRMPLFLFPMELILQPVTKYYDYDPVYLKEYTQKAKDDKQYYSYIEDTILKKLTHRDLLDSIGRERLEMIAADKNLGYAKNLDRK